MSIFAGADVLIESGAALVIQNNTATNSGGGGLCQQSEGFKLQGQWKQHARDD